MTSAIGIYDYWRNARFDELGNASRFSVALRASVPGLARRFVASRPLEQSPFEPHRASELVGDAKEAAKLLGVQLKIVEARTPAQLESAFAILHVDRASALLVVTGAGFYLNRAQIVELAKKIIPQATYDKIKDDIMTKQVKK